MKATPRPRSPRSGSPATRTRQREALVLSAGQNKRLALARLLLQRAPLWLLDEPYANLDLDGIALVDRLIGAHVAAGGAVLLTTHGAYPAPPVPVRTLRLDRHEAAA